MMTKSSGCSVVRTRKYGSSRRATVMSRRSSAPKMRRGETLPSVISLSFGSRAERGDRRAESAERRGQTKHGPSALCALPSALCTSCQFPSGEADEEGLEARPLEVNVADGESVRFADGEDPGDDLPCPSAVDTQHRPARLGV